MAAGTPPVAPGPRQRPFSADRVAGLLSTLERIAAGEIGLRLSMSDAHDELDAIAHGINVLVGELAWNMAQALKTQEARAADLHEAVARAERANASKNIFLRNVSHEIRTPIAAILGFAHLLASPDISPQERVDLARRVQANGQALLNLVGDIIDLARLDADRIVLSPESVSVVDLVHDVVATLELDTRSKGLDVRVDAIGVANGTLRTDRHRLRQILINLLTNALKFTESGSVSITLARSAETDAWTIDVTDTGIGIPPDRQPHLFEPFAQADSSIARTYGGAGLGLALSRRLAEQMGGTLVLLRSAPGEGSTFRLTVTALAPALEGVVSATEHGAVDRTPIRPPTPTIEGVRILLAEDHPDMRLAVRRLLEQAGALVLVASDGHEAVAQIRSHPFDVVLMDLRMPRLDGLEATRILRREGYTVPVIALTADLSAAIRDEAIHGGCDELVSKPLIQRDLISMICRLRNRQTQSS
jgi:signal transduction histidine kinase/CheY-like chemotaxis protein